MADANLRLRVESGEFDNKLKRATDVLRQLAFTAEKDSESIQQFAGNLGDMGTVAQTASGRANELRTAFRELSVVYQQLTDDEKREPFGRELASSLDTLKARYKEVQGQMQGADQELGEQKGLLDELSGSLGINVKAWGSLAGALGVAKGALSIMADAFMASESNVDDWGRTVSATQAAYDSFVYSLNTNDFNGFFAHIDDVVKAAKEAYDAIDKLNTFNSIRTPQRAKLDAENEADKAIIRRQGKDSAEGKAAQQRILAREKQYKVLARQEAGQNWDAGRNMVKQQLSSHGLANASDAFIDEVIEAMTNTAARNSFFKKRKGKRTVESYTDPMDMESYSGGGQTIDTRNAYQIASEYVMTDEFLKKANPYFTASYNAQREASMIESRNSRLLGSGSGGGGGRKGGGGASRAPYVAQTEALVFAPVDFAPEYNPLSGWFGQSNGRARQTNGNYELKGALDEIYWGQSAEWAQDELSKLKPESPLVFEPSFGSARERRNGQIENRSEKQLKAISDVGEKLGAGSALVGGISDLITQFGGNSEALKGLTTVLGIVNAALGVVTSALYINSAFHLFTNGGVVRAANGWGGVIGGHSNFGDRVPIMANSGEVVFNKTDASKLYDYVHNSSVLGGGSGQMRLSTEVSGTNLRIVLNNDGRSRGRGKVIN